MIERSYGMIEQCCGIIERSFGTNIQFCDTEKESALPFQPFFGVISSLIIFV
jgi:hypothetical protein